MPKCSGVRPPNTDAPWPAGATARRNAANSSRPVPVQDASDGGESTSSRRASSSSPTSTSSEPEEASSRMTPPSAVGGDGPAGGGGDGAPRRGFRGHLDGGRDLARRARHPAVGEQRHGVPAV